MAKPGSTSLNGWLTTKKRGRDDDAIERDQSKAREAQRRSRSQGKNNKSANANKKQKQPTTNKKKKKSGRIDDDDWIADDDEEEEVEELSEGEEESSLDGFIVDDDDDDDELEAEATSSSEDGEDDDDEGGGRSSFLPAAKKRTSRPRPLPQQQHRKQQQQQQQQQKPRSKPRSRTTAAAAAAATTTNTTMRKPRNVVSRGSSDGGILGDSRYFGGRKKDDDDSDDDEKKPAAKRKEEVDVLDVDDDDDDEAEYELFNRPVFGHRKKAAATAAAAAAAPKAGETVDLFDDDDDTVDDGLPEPSPDLPLAKRNSNNMKKNRAHFGDESDDDDDGEGGDDILALPTNHTRRLATAATTSVLEEQRQGSGIIGADEALARKLQRQEEEEVDPDEATALAWALRASQQNDAGDHALDLIDSPEPVQPNNRGRLQKVGAKNKKKKRAGGGEAAAATTAADEPYPLAWGKHLQELADFREEHKHCDFPLRYPSNPNLARWVSAQRNQRHLLETGNSGHSTMTPAKIRALNSLGFTWKINGTTNIKKYTKKEKTSSQENGEQPLLLEDSEEDGSDDDNNDEDEQDDYVDEDAREAGSILDTANQLSAEVLQTMTQWSRTCSTKGDDDDNDNNTPNTVPMGMIVDGALSLATIKRQQQQDTSGSGGDAARNQWISHECIKPLCPSLTLSEYQLVGVNWLALLHNMKCKVQGKGKKSVTTNVNGVLADEMGLGKTVQTIAFLAWLAFENRGKNPDNKNIGTTAAKSSKNEPIVLDGDNDDDHSVVSIDDDDDDNDKGQKTRAESRPHLVVAPSSVLENWEREFKAFAPHMNVVKYHGSQLERGELQRKLELYRPGREESRELHGVEPLDVILAPVTYFQKKNSDDRGFLRKFQFDYLVVDEAHLLKNARGMRYRSLDRFSTEHRLLLTGTPVQNSPKELMCLLSFLMPLFSRKTSSHFDDDDKNDGGERMLQHFVSLEGQSGKTSDEAAYRKLKQLFAPFVLRRKKKDVMSQMIPPKERKVAFVDLDSVARSIYDSILADHIKKKKLADASSREHLFTQLRKAAHHPLLIRSRYKSSSEKTHLADCFLRFGAFRGEGCTQEKVLQELEKFNDFDIHLTAYELVQESELRRPDLDRYILKEEDLFRSAKCARLRTLLPELVNDGHRILIFSVWTSCLDLLSCLLEQLGMDYLRMEGSTPVSERQSLIDRFNRESSIPVFLLSTKACGLGITLTAADTCIMHDLDFNPFNDLQAEDRCHRIGQKRPVTVIKMVTKDTVDEDIYAMQERKAKMNAAIMENKVDGAAEKDTVLKTAVARYTAAAGSQKENRLLGETDAV